MGRKWWRQRDTRRCESDGRRRLTVEEVPTGLVP